jgi:hypothetical protein
MKDNLIPFPGKTGGNLDEADDFCGAAGFMFEGGTPRPALLQSDADTMELYAFEAEHIVSLSREIEEAGLDRAEEQFDSPDALTPEFKALLLAALARRKKENLRNGRILTVSHPDMAVHEQIPFLVERSAIPAITIRRCTPEDRQQMFALRKIFPELLAAHNAVGSSFARKPEPGHFLAY